ncbi:DUF6134 family protein [Aestuariivivens sediminicola]|uniref:DUF6134 family protein n=1 Tax=Aestuariivivens sediminicola TaxID=2913560 RepID=UPI001F576DE3|nr:DUF6134 family protein [Aestuariivivens sediminicola]
MIPMLILYLIKKAKERTFNFKRLFGFKKLLLRLKLGLTVLITTVSYGINEEPVHQISFNVVRNNKVIGSIDIRCKTQNDSTIYVLESQIKAKYILAFNIKGKEKTVFKDDLLIYSSVFRKVNNKIKSNHSLSYRNQKYQLEKSGKVEHIGFNEIHRNLVTLYFTEPKGISTIYVDNETKMVNIKDIGFGKYQVRFSDGKYNVYHYSNGRCVKVEANSSLFNVTLILV